LLVPEQQLLLDGEKPVHIGSRASEILVTLDERQGELVGKDELIAKVWPDTFVHDANLKVNIAAIRKVLGESPSGPQYIVIMMSQNRQDEKDRVRAELDYEVNVRAEAEIKEITNRIEALSDKLSEVEGLVRGHQGAKSPHESA
jgi:two-component SAPR family response regulator